jgi:hypothetical protein
MRMGIVLMILASTLWVHAADDQKSEKKVRIFEQRTYYAPEGKMAALHARFRDHTCKLFQKHGMTLVAFFQPIDDKEAQEKMTYILAHDSKEAAKKSWAAFQADPEWIKAKTESEKDGKLVSKVDVMWLEATDYSPFK